MPTTQSPPTSLETDTLLNIWDRIKLSLASRISAEAFQNWLAKTSFRQVDGDAIFVSVPNEATKEWIESEYGDCIRTVIRELNLPIRRIHYELSAGETRSAYSPEFSSSPESMFQSPISQLNARFTFDNYVVGSCNQFAHAAAKAVATKPSRSYNPLFIYGGVGMGKTHLMHAIGRSLVENFGGMRIVYTTSERFMNQMINCIKLDRLTQFHQHYRSADVLLIDDIQTIGGKERTQDEFFYTFNELYDHQKQIVISSDAPPKNTPGLIERLRSRFEWGLMVDVLPPDLETKMAILDKKAEQDGIRLPEDVRIFIATKTKSNVRELEGALIKLIAYSSVTGSPINLAMAQQILKHLVPGQDRRVTIDSVLRAVAEKFSMQPSQIKQKSNSRQIAYPRQVAMYLVKELTSASLPEIGRAFGGKHHTTVLHSIQKIEQQRHVDPELNRMIHSLIDTLH
ncbi:MAG TPA: chromosomal replication initiator protein DnaA [Bryobacteraceae bacterium]|nr:chromosomal replication initiator protein DnaA [Bryobacteraceae bacterium]